LTNTECSSNHTCRSTALKIFSQVLTTIKKIK